MKESQAYSRYRAALVLALAPAISACSTTAPHVGPVSASPVVALGQSGYEIRQSAQYLLRPADVISVTVFREPDLTVPSVPIGADGTVALPLIGTLSAAGLTTADLTDEVARQLDDSGLKRPKVSINILEFGSHQVTVEGGVEKPGVYDFRPGSKLSSAIALASGPNRVAKLREVAIFRENAQGMSVALFDYSAVRDGSMIDPVIEPGDRVVVGISGLSQFWQDFLKALPAFAIFSNVNF
ncbi:MAG: polysaccharide export protein [Alphaproteobacteria bacterium]|nr:MAG: polysaccharide export protein [Alphaproteobacteria bacterium]